ncbi:iron-siderophore ABC transporter substrate-binding protein [Psychrobacter sp. B38]|uniref:ABC transporter substrate-binding protein n=1 Tax=Psychrobacter sp. B38 TaxID=3143538 RepID=UPI00320D9B6B
MNDRAGQRFYKTNKGSASGLTSFAFITLCLWLCATVSASASADTTTRTVKHALGETVIDGQPKRVVSLFQGATDTLVALGVEPVGVVESWAQKPMYSYLRPQLKNVTYVGLETQPSLEDIALLKPDLIIASRYRSEKIYGILSQIAPTIALEEVYDFRQTLKTTGKALGKEDKANQLLTDWQKRIIETRHNLQAHFGRDWPQKVSLLDFRSDHVRLYTPNSFSGSILSDLGFKWPKVVEDRQWAPQKLVSKESIPLIDADMYFVLMKDDPAVQKNYQSWSQHLLWQQTQAAKTNHIYQVDNIYWSLAGGIISANHMLDEVDTIFHPPYQRLNQDSYKVPNQGQYHGATK